MKTRRILLLAIASVCVSLLIHSAKAAETKSKKFKPLTFKPKKSVVPQPPKGPDWPLLECGQDLKATSKNIETYQKKLLAQSEKLSRPTRESLFSTDSIYGESLTLLTPQIFWKDIMVSRGTKACHNRFKNLVKSLETNDSKGVGKKLTSWNSCVSTQYGVLPKQSTRINECVAKGVAYIKHQRAKAK